MTAQGRSRQGLRPTLRTVWRRLRGGEFHPVRFALSVAVGLFIGSLPLYGLHLPLCTLVCLPLRLDLVVAYVAANVSNPLVAPLLVVAEVDLGSLLLSGQHAPFDVARARENGVSGFAAQAAVGALALGSLLAASGGGLAFVLASAFRRRRQGSSRSPQSASSTRDKE